MAGALSFPPRDGKSVEEKPGDFGLRLLSSIFLSMGTVTDAVPIFSANDGSAFLTGDGLVTFAAHVDVFRTLTGASAAGYGTGFTTS